jgi:hypothetical protein
VNANPEQTKKKKFQNKPITLLDPKVRRWMGKQKQRVQAL